MKIRLLTGCFLFPFLAMGEDGVQPARGTLTIGEREREYYLHVPAGLSKEKPAPLVFVFHGGGGNARQAEKMAGFDKLADYDRVFVVYPEGVDHSWNDGRNDPHISAQRKKVDDVNFISTLLDDLMKRYPIDSKRIYATGVSNGGMMCHRLAAELSDRFTAIAPVIGGMPVPTSKSFHPVKPVSMMIINGTKDPIVPFHGGEVQVIKGRSRGEIIDTSKSVELWVQFNGCHAVPKTLDLPDKDPGDGTRVHQTTHAGGKEGSEVILYTVEGGGHGWPGGRPYLPEKWIGKVCRDFSASEVIWQFFMGHRRK